MNVWFVIAAFNEASVIGDVVLNLRSRFPHVVVVDDCSRDATSEAALAAGASVCRHCVNLGQGAALQTGIDHALAQGADAIVTFDADGQHRPEDAEAMIERLAAGGVDVVLGSRFLGQQSIGMTRGKRLLLKAATLYTRLTTGLAVTDTHNGLRCLSRRAASAIRIRQNRMAHASELLAAIASQRLSFTEMPCTVVYTDYSRAKGQRMSGSLRIVFDLAIRSIHK